MVVPSRIVQATIKTTLYDKFFGNDNKPRQEKETPMFIPPPTPSNNFPIIFSVCHICLALFYLAAKKRRQRQLVQNTISTCLVLPVFKTCMLASVSIYLVSDAVCLKSWDFPESGYNFWSAYGRVILTICYWAHLTRKHMWSVSFCIFVRN